MKQGVLRKRDKIMAKSIGKVHQTDSVGIFTPKRLETGELQAGEVGYVVAGIKDIHGAPVGDTLINSRHPEVHALPGFQQDQTPGLCGYFYHFLR